jgi:fumarate reductase subunit C
MSAQAHHTPYHPKWYRRPVSVWWWLKKGSYAAFVLRELTSVAVAWFAAVLLWQVLSVARGPAAYAEFLARLGRPGFLILHGLALTLVLFHSVSWFHLAPKAMVVRVGGKRMPDGAVVALNYLAWAAASAAVAFILLRG